MKIIKSKPFVILLMTICFVFLFSNNIAFADVDIVGHGEFKDDISSDYELVIVPDEKMLEEDEGIVDNIVKWGKRSMPVFGVMDATEALKEGLDMSAKIPPIVNYLAHISFQYNIIVTKVIISVLEFSYEFDYVNNMIDEMEAKIQDASGISGNKIGGGGTFGSFAGIIAVFSVVYAVFILIFKRSVMSSFNVLLQTIVVIALSLLIFTNYATFIKGANIVTSEASAFILGGSSKNSDGKVSDLEARIEGTNLITNMKDNVWTMFVDRPYLYMMWGTPDLEKIGDGSREEGIKRVKKILKVKGDKKIEAAEKDARGKGKFNENEYLLYSAVGDRMAFTPLYFMINGLVAVPIGILAFSLIFFQFWFLIIAMFAPFALLIGAIPGQFGVFKRWFVELSIPLLLKIFATFLMFGLFMISDVLYGINFTTSEDFKKIIAVSPVAIYALIGLLHMVMFASVFLLRHRLKAIFSSGSQTMEMLRKEASNSIKSPIQGGASAIGAGVGAFAGGPQGAIIGANIGGSIGKTATGDQGIGEMVGDVSRSALQAQNAKNLSKLADVNNADNAIEDMEKQKSVDDSNKDDNKKEQEEKEQQDDTNKQEPNAKLKCEKCGNEPCTCEDDEQDGSGDVDKTEQQTGELEDDSTQQEESSNHEEDTQQQSDDDNETLNAMDSDDKGQSIDSEDNGIDSINNAEVNAQQQSDDDNETLNAMDSDDKGQSIDSEDNGIDSINTTEENSQQATDIEALNTMDSNSNNEHEPLDIPKEKEDTQQSNDIESLNNLDAKNNQETDKHTPSKSIAEEKGKSQQSEDIDALNVMDTKKGSANSFDTNDNKEQNETPKTSSVTKDNNSNSNDGWNELKDKISSKNDKQQLNNTKNDSVSEGFYSNNSFVNDINTESLKENNIIDEQGYEGPRSNEFNSSELKKKD